MNKLIHNRVFLSWFGMTLGTLLYCFAIVFVIDLGSFYTGGVTGLCQVVANGILHKPQLKSLFVAISNIPLFLLGFKKVSKRFAILSLASVAVQTISLYLFQLIYDKWGSPFSNIVLFDDNGNIDQYGRFILAVLGGILTGTGCGLSLKYGASTGGTDIISQAYSFKTNKSFAAVSFSIDIFVVLLGMFTSQGDLGAKFAVGLYTIIRLAMNSLTLDKIYKIYTYQKICIITKHPEEVKEALLANFQRGITIYEGKGGFTNEPKYILESVVLSYEVEDYRRLLAKVDPKAFTYYESVKGIQGKFVKKAIS